MKNLLIIALLSMSISAVAQQGIKGIGILSPALILDGPESVAITDITFELNLYESPGALSGDCLSRDWSTIHYMRTQVVEKDGTLVTQLVQDKGWVWTGYKSFSLQFYEQKKGRGAAHAWETSCARKRTHQTGKPRGRGKGRAVATFGRQA